VTRSKGNIIYEIDGKPAMEVFEEYLPKDALTDDRDWFRYAISLSLCFRAPSYMTDEEYVVRGMPAVSMADGSITVQTEVSEGTSNEYLALEPRQGEGLQWIRSDGPTDQGATRGCETQTSVPV
jgi:hypothetical protein